MEFRVKGLLNLDSALTSVLTAAEMKIAVATTIASSAMVVSSVDVEVKNHSAVQIEIQETQSVQTAVEAKTSDRIFVPVTQTDNWQAMSFIEEARSFDQSAVDSYQAAVEQIASRSSNRTESVASSSSSSVGSVFSGGRAARGTKSVRPSRRSSGKSPSSRAGRRPTATTRTTSPSTVSTAPPAPSVAVPSGAGAPGVSSPVVDSSPPPVAPIVSPSSDPSPPVSSGGGSKNAVGPTTNSAPVLAATCTATVAQDAAYSCTPAVADSDSGDTQTWSLDTTNTCAWAAVDSASGAVSGTPNDDQVGSCTLAFKTNDGTVDSNIVSTSMTISNVVPTLTIANAANINEDAAATVIRADGDVQASEETFGTYSFDHATTSGTKCDDNKISLSLDSSTGAVTYQPAANYNGTCNIKVSFDDGNSGVASDEFSITVDAVNDVPVITATCPTSLNQDVAYSCSVAPAVNDPDTGDTQTWSLDGTNTCTWATINSGTGALSGTPNDDQVGSCTLAFKTNDGTVDSNVISQSVTVNNVVPTLSIANAANINEDAAATVIRADGDVQASDEGFGTYSFDHATTTVPKCDDNKISLSLDSSTGAVTYQPAASYNGTCNIKVSFDDGNSGTVSDEFSITVSPVNNAPVITATCPTSLNQDVAYSCSVAPDVSDPDTGDTHTWSLNGTNTCSWISINSSTGALSGTPNDDQVGACTLAFKTNDGTVDSNVISQSVTVNNVVPTLTIANAANINEDAASTVIRTDAQVQASEETFGTYSFDHATTTAPKCDDNKISLSIDSSTGAVTYQPAANYNGTCNIKVSFDDGNSGVASDEFSITVDAVNDVPVITATCPTSLNQDVAYSCSVAPAVSDSDTGDTHTWSLDGTNTCSWISINSSTGALSGTPNDNQVGACTLAFKTNDGTVDSNVVSQSVTVNNVVPTLSIANAANINEDAAATVIRVDADVQASEETFGTYSFDHATTSGTKCDDNKISLSIDSSTGAVTYQPAANYNGTCNIKVSFDDGNSGVASDEFSITVDAVNDVPSITATCPTSLNEDSAYVCSVAPAVSDSDTGDTHTWSFDGTNTCAWATINSGTGAVGGTPNDGHVGACTLAFKTNDGTVDSNVISQSVTVNNVVPTLTIANAANINEDTAATVIRADGDVQASDEGFGTYSFDHATTSGTKCDDNKISLSIDSATGAVTYQPAANYNGTCNIKVSFDDGNSGVVSDEFSITVDAVNDVPSITATCPTSLNQDVAYSCSVAPAVSDPDTGDTHTWSFDGTHTCLWASINSSTGALSGTPNDDEVGACTLAFKTNDGTVDSNVISQSVTVNNVVPTLSIANAANINEDAASTTIRTDAQVQASEEGFGTYSFLAATAPDCRDNDISSTISASNGQIDFQPAANYNGTCNFKVQFDDGNSGTVSDEFSITVDAVNDVPAITATCPTSLNQDVAYSCSVAPAVNDPDTGDTHTWSLDGTNTCSWISINSSTGALSGTANDNQVGSCTLAFKTNDGTVDSNVISQSVTVNNVVPTLTIANAADVKLNHTLLEVRGDADVQADEEGFGTYSFDHATTTAPKCDDNKVALSINSTTGAITYEPAVDYTGTCNVKVSFDDGNSGVGSDEFSITVVSATPALDLSFTNCASFPSEVTFTRASTATYFDSAGVMQTATANTPRCNYDPATLTVKGLLIEESRENVYIRSEELDNTLWTSHGLAAVVTANGTSAPDGATTAELVEDDSTITSESVQQSVTGVVSDSEYWTCSAFVKRNSANPPSNESSALNCRVFGGSTAINPYVLIDWNTHTVTAAVAPADPAESVGIQNVGNGWYRIWVTVENNATGNTDVSTSVSPSHDSSWSATPTGSVYAWGVQAEKGSVPTSYIPTTTTAVTRAADDADVTNLTFFDTDKGAFFANVHFPVVDPGYKQPILEMSDGTALNYHQWFITASADKIRIRIDRSGVEQGRINSLAVTANTLVKTGYAYAASEMSLSKDGVNEGSDTPANLPAPITSMQLGRRVNSSFYLHGHLESLQYWDYRIGNTAMDAKTAP